MNKQLKPQLEMLRDWLKLAKDASRIDQALRRYANAQGFEWFAYLSVHEADVYGMSNYPAGWRSNVRAISPGWIRSSKQYARAAAYCWSDTDLPIPSRRCHRQFSARLARSGSAWASRFRSSTALGRRALFTFASGELKPDTTLLADPYSVLTLGAFFDGYLQSRDCENLMTAASSPLTPYQLECLPWLLQGKNNDDIASLRNVSRRAVEFQLQSIRQKLNVVTTYQALGIAVETDIDVVTRIQMQF